MNKLLVITSCILISCSNNGVLPDPDRDFYGEVRSHVSTYIYAKLSKDEYHILSKINFESVKSLHELNMMIYETDLDIDLNNLKINRILTRYRRDKNPEFEVNNDLLLSSIISGIRDVVGGK